MLRVVSQFSIIPGFIISGGRPGNSSKKVEVYNPSSGNSCPLPDLEEGIYRHTSCSGLRCGGGHYDSSSSRSCVKVNGTEVSPLTSLKLKQMRRDHMCWSLPGDGDTKILLLGGDDSRTSTEIVSGSSSSLSFALPYNT